jgi:hypothetical protein
MGAIERKAQMLRLDLRIAVCVIRWHERRGFINDSLGMQPVNRTRAQEDDMLQLMVAGGLQHMPRAFHVDAARLFEADIVRIDDTVDHLASAGHRPGNGVPVRYISCDDRNRG